MTTLHGVFSSAKRRAHEAKRRAHEMCWTLGLTWRPGRMRPYGRAAAWLAAAAAALPLTLWAATLPAANAADADANAAVILQYHRFGESNLPSTNITLEQFEAHIAHLQSGGYTVLPVLHILEAIRAGRPLPDRTVGITIDDGARSVFTEAWPRLSAAGLPFTVFITTDTVDEGHGGSMTWEQIRQLAEAGVTIGNHSAAHGHMWRNDAVASRADIAKAQNRLKEELEIVPTLFVYPYGEYDLALRGLVQAMGFAAAFGQSSGVVHAGTDFMALPRFSLNETYGDIDRFRLIVDTLPLPAMDLTPIDPLLTQNPPMFGFTLAEPLERVRQLACFASGQGSAEIERLGERRIEVRMAEPFPPGRARINCTMPGPDNRWRWLGVQYLVPRQR